MTIPVRAPTITPTPLSLPLDDEAPEASAVEASAAREERASADASVSARVARQLDGFVADMFSLVEIYQARTRDTQSRTQEQGIRAHASAAREAQEQRVAQAEQAATDRARAAEQSGIGNILKIVGAVLASAIGIVGAVFTGGASIVAAIAIAVAVLGPIVMDALANEGLISREEALGIGIGIAAVCTVVSFGASVASLTGVAAGAAVAIADEAIQSAVEVANLVASTVSAAIDVSAGVAQFSSAITGRDAADHEIAAVAQGHRRDAERELEDRAMEQLTMLARSFARVSESLATCREESTGAMRAALGRA